MATYSSYLDEDIDYDEGLGESYLDLDEDFDDFDEAVRPRDNRRGSSRLPIRGGRRLPSRQGSRAGSRPAAVNSGSVRNAFRNVGQDVAVLDKRFKTVAAKQSNEQFLEILSLLAFRPKPITTQLKESTLVDANGRQITEITTGIENNLLPLILIKFLGNSAGKNTQQYLLIGLAAMVLFPDTLKSLGLGGTSSASTSDTPPAAPINTNLLLVGGLVYLATKGKI